MKFLTGFAIGAGVGYVLGAAAGRERYEEIVRAAEGVLQDERVQEMHAKGRKAMDAGTEKARDMMSQGFNGASQKIRDKAEG